ncbi:flagellar motor switch protein FliG [Desulforegula conservatrix]|uniref:flagellar motor switch protein FliG n=1 Tax=Desulforegula conservatrix TaxID=153026 RepID=UPI00041B6657|nr:flagellar motor switch protein FliG [Desulforegula conservatrix]
MTDEEKGGLTGQQKAAIFLIAMGEDYAANVFKRMSDREIRKAATAMATLEKIEPAVVAKVMEEFIEQYEGDVPIMVQGDTFIKNVLGKALEKERADIFIKEVEEGKRDVPFDWSWKVNTSTMSSYLGAEHPQTVAMVLAHLPPEISAEVMIGLPDERKGDIALRIAKLGQIPEDIIRDVDDALRAEFSGVAGKGSKGGGLQVLVDILNGVNKETEELVMETIEEENPDMAEDIKGMMFVFEDLLNVDDKAMREILKKVEGSQLTIALKTASDEMKKKILGNLSARAAEMLMEDLEIMGPVKLSDVEGAQSEVVRAAKELESEGTITLGGKGKGDVFV